MIKNYAIRTTTIIQLAIIHFLASASGREINMFSGRDLARKELVKERQTSYADYGPILDMDFLLPDP